MKDHVNSAHARPRAAKWIKPPPEMSLLREKILLRAKMFEYLSIKQEATITEIMNEFPKLDRDSIVHAIDDLNSSLKYQEILKIHDPLGTEQQCLTYKMKLKERQVIEAHSVETAELSSIRNRLTTKNTLLFPKSHFKGITIGGKVPKEERINDGY